MTKKKTSTKTKATLSVAKKPRSKRKSDVGFFREVDGKRVQLTEAEVLTAIKEYTEKSK